MQWVPSSLQARHQPLSDGALCLWCPHNTNGNFGWDCNCPSLTKKIWFAFLIFFRAFPWSKVLPLVLDWCQTDRPSPTFAFWKKTEANIKTNTLGSKHAWWIHLFCLACASKSSTSRSSNESCPVLQTMVLLYNRIHRLPGLLYLQFCAVRAAPVPADTYLHQHAWLTQPTASGISGEASKGKKNMYMTGRQKRQRSIYIKKKMIDVQCRDNSCCS